MTGEARSALEVARQLALAGAETAVRTPKEQLPFTDSGPAMDRERWRELGEAMRDCEADGDSILHRLRDGFALAPLDCWLVLLCGAAERYPEAAAAFAIMMDQPHSHVLTPVAFAQIMHAAAETPLEEGLCTALEGGSIRKGLVEAIDAPGRPHSHQALRLAAAEIPALLGIPADRDSAGTAHDEKARRVRAFDDAFVRLAAELLKERRLLLLRGPSPRAQRQFAVDLASWFDRDPYFVPVGEAPAVGAILRAHEGLPIADLTDLASTVQWRQVLAQAQRAIHRLVVLVREDFLDGGLVSLNGPRLGWREAERIWTETTGDERLGRELASRFRVNAAEASAAFRHASRAAALSADRSRAELIASHVLDEGARRMGKLVTRITSAAVLDDLVVPPLLRAQLLDIVAWQRHSPHVFGPMGMGRRTPLGRGLACLFSGPPGTGKTFAAQCLTNELGLNLYRIDLSQVVSKYIGETEKALSTVFDEAEAGHGVLLFDEADALFGKRSEVKDAHDRYANIEVGYLLQRLEAYEGVAILATNLRSNMDPAFLRRLRFMLEFPMPDASMRRQLWEQSLPSTDFRAPELDVSAFVDRFRLSGGSIQNIGLAAAHMAAATPACRIRVDHLVRATYRELEKAGQTRDRATFGPLADYLPAEVA